MMDKALVYTLLGCVFWVAGLLAALSRMHYEALLCIAASLILVIASRYFDEEDEDARHYLLLL